MRPLSEVFAPGAPTLPERLRTLVVSPERELEPGMTVRATFTFRNHGGAPATGVQIRFNVPDGLVYLVGSGLLDGVGLDDELGNSPLLARGGALVGDVLPNEERRVEIAYSVAGAIENGTTVELQAAVASFELPCIGSNVVRLVARSKPALANALTSIAIEAARDAEPGSQAQVTIRIHNAGESTARDVVVVSPIPEHTSYIAGSARVNGREIERELGTAFDRTYAPVVLRSLPARASATLVYRVAIEAPLPGGTQIVARADVASQETPAFALGAASLTVVSAPTFGEDRTAFSVDSSHDVRPGDRVRFTLTAFNAGTAAAEHVTARLELSDNLFFVRGAATIDGRPIRERRKEPLRFQLGTIDAGQCVTLCADGVLASPLADKSVVSAAATIEWEPPASATRRLECSLYVRSEPVFSSRRNALTRTGSAIAVPGSTLEAVVVLENDGSAGAHDGVLHLRIEPALDDVAVFEGGRRLAFEGRPSDSLPDTVELGTIEAYDVRRLTIRARVPSPFADASELRIGASLHTRELGESPLPFALWRVDSHPVFDRTTSLLELSGQSVLRPNQLAQVDVVVANIGTDTAHNVSLRCYISPEARLENVDGATREKSSLLFGQLAPGAHARARLGLRLLRGLAKDWPVTVDSLLTADGMLPVPLGRLTIATSAEPDFSTGNLQSEPAESVDPGETVEWVLHVRNAGDGAARVAHISIAAPDSLIYVPNSTTVNDVPIRDAGALPPFAGEPGIALNDVDPGVEATVRWRSVVHNALAAGTSIAHLAHIRYDGERDDEIVSAELRVRATPIFANSIPGLPFGLDGVLGPALTGQTRALSEERFLQLPAATPVGDGNGARPLAQLTAGHDDDTHPEFLETTGIDVTGTIAAFTPDRLSRTLRLLREARFGGLIAHLFAVRAFLPEAIGDAHCAALGTARELLREELDRLFIKLRLPLYVLAARDVETPSLRSTLERLMHEAATARGVPAESPTAAITLRGSFDSGELQDLGERLAQAQLATAPPWAALARLLPDETSACSEYRALLIEVLDRFEDSDCNEFIDALQHRGDVPLDAALDTMVASMHSMA